MQLEASFLLLFSCGIVFTVILYENSLIQSSLCGSNGLDLLKGTVRNNLEAGVIEPAMSKVKIIQVLISYSNQN